MCCGSSGLAKSDDSVTEALQALRPKSAAIGGNNFISHSIADLIAWQRHRILVRAARNSLGTVRSIRLAPSPQCRGRR